KQNVNSKDTISTTEVKLGNAYDGSEYSSIETFLGGVSGVVDVHLDRTRGVVHVAYNPSAITTDAIETCLNGCGYDCDCQGRAASKCQPGHPAVGTKDAIGSSKTALTSSEAIESHPAHLKDESHVGAPAHAEMPHDEHAGHDASMVHDFFRRFIVSIFLSIPILLFSPMGKMFGLPGMPLSLPMDLFGFVLATPVVWWGGWPFISAAWRALRRAEVNMMTLIALGILVSYLYSVAATFLFKGEVFYEAAAMLTSFSLAGHWLEMRSRFATGRAIEALLRLTPATARVKRHGRETEVPLEEVSAG